jgi:hypothetical protein
MTDTTIPPEALEAAAKELYEVHPYTDEDDDVIPWEELYMIDKEEYLDFARSACLAMLKAWPGMMHIIEGEPGRESAEIILPLPKENTSDKG